MTEVETPLIAHVIFRLDTGGLENGLVNLINRMPQDRYRHAIICIDSYTDFRFRIQRDDVEIIAINKRPGTDFRALWRILLAIRRVRPTILHTRNLAALDALVPAILVGVGWRIHGEHGWDVSDLGKINFRHKWLRRIYSPLISRYVALSKEIEDYLVEAVGIGRHKIRRIHNGVDTDKFRPSMDKAASRQRLMPKFAVDSILVGTVGRIQAVKDQMNLAEAFILLANSPLEQARNARLVIVGDGELRADIIERLVQAGVADLCWLPGNRDDIPEILQCLDIFVQPSLAEGISNTILEAMASGLPIVATNVGGNAELVQDDRNGLLVKSGSSEALANALAVYVVDHSRRTKHGIASRSRAEKSFAVACMVRRYVELYDEKSGYA